LRTQLCDASWSIAEERNRVQVLVLGLEGLLFQAEKAAGPRTCAWSAAVALLRSSKAIADIS
jgi:hypothetical protein